MTRPEASIGRADPPTAATVGFVLKGYPRLSETFIVNEILRLEELGHDLHIFALRNPGEKKVHDCIQRVRARVTYIPDYFWPFFFSFLKCNVSLSCRRPLRYWKAFFFALLHSVRRRTTSTLKRFLQAAYLVERGLPGTGVVHLHSHFSHCPTVVAFFAGRLAGLSYSFSAHAKDIYVQDREFLRKKIRRAEFVVTCTEYNRKYLEQLAGGGVPVLRSYHGVNLGFFEHGPRSMSRSEDSCPTILSVGRFVPKKGFPVLLHALQQLRAEGHRFRAFLIGGGPMQKQLEDLVIELGLADTVELVTQLSQTELFPYYRRADVFALACEIQDDGDRDGIPNVLVEAMAMGLPVVSTSISGIPELVENETTGFLVRQRDPQALARAMAKLLCDPDLAQRLGHAGRVRVTRDFDTKRNVARISEILRSVLARRTQRREQRSLTCLATD